jgi:DNA-binding transcriptional LysR family regulator
MRGLEQDVGMTLFDRSRRPPALTAEGYDFALRAREVIGTWEQLSESLKRGADSGILRIGAVHTAVGGLLPEALLRLRAAAPNLSIRLTTGLTDDLEAALRGGRVDAAIVTQPESLHPETIFRVFCEERLVVLAHESAQGTGFRDILRDNPYLRFSRNARVAKLVEAKLRECEIEVNSHMEIDTLEGVISLVSSGLGVSIVPERLGSMFPKGVSAHQFGTTPSVRHLGLLSPTETGKTRFIEQLYEALVCAAEAASSRHG